MVAILKFKMAAPTVSKSKYVVFLGSLTLKT